MWINALEELPIVFDEVLATDGTFIAICIYEGDNGWSGDLEEITHWMPLPFLPVPYRTSNKTRKFEDWMPNCS